MARQPHEPLTDAERAKAAQLAIGCMNPAQIREALRRMALYRTDIEKYGALQVYMMELAIEGGHCVTCGGHIQLQYRPVNKGQAYAAMQFCEYFADPANKLVPGTHYIKPENVLRSASRSRELAKLRHWGLVKGQSENPGEPGYLSRPVLWTICLDPANPAGELPPLMRYVKGWLKLPHHAVLIHNQFICYKGPLEGIEEVTDFDMDEYMDIRRKAGPPPPYRPGHP
jgi:hypothetical protein